MVDWQPIETAPRDGVVMLWFPALKDQEAQFGYWHVYEDAPWCPGEWRDRDNSEEFIRGDNARVHPSHWAPTLRGPDADECPSPTGCDYCREHGCPRAAVTVEPLSSPQESAETHIARECAVLGHEFADTDESGVRFCVHCKAEGDR